VSYSAVKNQLNFPDMLIIDLHFQSDIQSQSSGNYCYSSIYSSH